jgi:CheY-like chemotaxis protein
VTQKVITDTLKGAGYEVVTARDASTTVRLVREEKPDLITLDILLAADVPEDMMDGFTIAKWLQRINPDREIPIIVISGLDPQEATRGAAAIRALQYLPKPVDKAALLAAVQAALG